MNKLAITTGLALLITTGMALAEPMTSGRPSAVLTPEQCQEVWKKAVPTGDVLAEKDAKPYIAVSVATLWRSASTKTAYCYPCVTQELGGGHWSLHSY